jgi:cysteine desulfurase
MKQLYLDDAATTAVKPPVLKAMLPYFTKKYANPSSEHDLGREARVVVEKARSTIANYLGAKPQEIYFTSGVTEANNWVFQGLLRAHKHKKKILISSIEHGSTIEVCAFLEKQGYTVVRIPVNKEGFVDLDFLKHELDDKTLVVSVMHANNLFGTVQHISEIAKICKSRGVLFHTDASQTLGVIDLNVNSMQLDLVSACAHKIGGPKGIGFLYIREGVKIEPLIFGGGQQKGMRGGTENVPGIVGLAAALTHKPKPSSKLLKLQNLCMQELEEIGGKINGPKTGRLPGNIHVSFKGIDSNTLLAFLSKSKIYVSVGSACDSHRVHEDYVLKAIGLPLDLMKGSIRITLNDKVSEKDVKRIIATIKKDLHTLRI